MSLTRVLVIASAVLSLTLAHAPDNGKRAPFEAAGIDKNTHGFGSEAVALDEAQAALAPLAQLEEKNATMPQLKDRSLELVDRQSCNAGYWYCSAFGRCCPTTTLCCSYGYCIDPSDTCCPGGSCKTGFTCCGSNCAPRNGDCCSDGNYCSAGNICVKLYSNGAIVCCTDTKCTAAVISGTTSILSSSRVPPPSVTAISVPSITAPPRSTQVATIGGSYTTWYWTVTWWYYSFYYSTFQAQSTVTYTRIYQTTTFTTTATDRIQASSLFSSLSATLTFQPPASAHTSLASLVNALPTATGSFSVGNDFGSTTASDSVTATSAASSAIPTSVVGNPQRIGAAGKGVLVQWILVGMGTLSGVLMVWL